MKQNKGCSVVEIYNSKTGQGSIRPLDSVMTPIFFKDTQIIAPEGWDVLDHRKAILAGAIIEFDFKLNDNEEIIPSNIHIPTEEAIFFWRD
jgi:hypothetical protein